MIIDKDFLTYAITQKQHQLSLCEDGATERKLRAEIEGLRRAME